MGEQFAAPRRHRPQEEGCEVGGFVLAATPRLLACVFKLAELVLAIVVVFLYLDHLESFLHVWLERELRIIRDHCIVKLFIDHARHNTIDGFLGRARHIILHLLSELGSHILRHILLIRDFNANIGAELLWSLV